MIARYSFIAPATHGIIIGIAMTLATIDIRSG